MKQYYAILLMSSTIATYASEKSSPNLNEKDKLLTTCNKSFIEEQDSDSDDSLEHILDLSSKFVLAQRKRLGIITCSNGFTIKPYFQSCSPERVDTGLVLCSLDLEKQRCEMDEKYLENDENFDLLK